MSHTDFKVRCVTCNETINGFDPHPCVGLVGQDPPTRASAHAIEEERRHLLDAARARDGTPVAKKFDAGKPRMDLIPPIVLRLMADVLEFGTRKYGANNWASGDGLPWSKLYAALQRHLNDWWEGHALDPETNKPALAHALCQLVFLLASEQYGLGTDDRFDWSHRKKAVSSVTTLTKSELEEICKFYGLVGGALVSK